VSPLAVVLMLVLIAVVVLVVSRPLRESSRRVEPQVSQQGVSADGPHVRVEGNELEAERERDELEAAREAKYREIRDTELDYRTGKLSREDFEAIDGELRAEAIEILDRLQAPEA
jgi:flagellar biosynthesis/type III secretory pathway M-ring protein FliF/YscJ